MSEDKLINLVANLDDANDKFQEAQRRLWSARSQVIDHCMDHRKEFLTVNWRAIRAFVDHEMGITSRKNWDKLSKGKWEQGKWVQD